VSGIEKPSNIVSLAHRRAERSRRLHPTRPHDAYSQSLEERLARLEADFDRLLEAVVDTTKLAEDNRDYMMRLLRLLKDKELT